MRQKNWFAHLLGSAIRLVVVVIRFHVVSKAENALALVLAFINNFRVVVVLHGLLLRGLDSILCVHVSIYACHPCAEAMLISSVSFQF